MSFREYLHEKAEESRHEETLAFLVFVAGAVFFVGGLLTTLSLGSQPQWFVIIPYLSDASSGSVLGLTLLISGVCLTAFGLVSGVHYSRDRSWYMTELQKAHSAEANSSGKRIQRNETRKKNDSRL